MEKREVQTKVHISRGKFNGMNAIAETNGIIAAAAMDQRRSFRQAIEDAKGSAATDEELSMFKILVTEVLSPYASAILLDPEYGLEAVKHRAENVGLLLTYEKAGYDPEKGRLPDVLPQWSVRRLIAAGAQAIKFLLYYDPGGDEQTNTAKQTFIKRIGTECHTSDVPFFLEVVTYSDEIPDEKSIDFARVKPFKVKTCMQEFSKPEYEADVLKVEIPVNSRYVEGLKANSNNQVAYSREEAEQYLREAAAASRIPFIYLSAGARNDVFLETLELAAEANVPFSGVLCGRATWQDGIKVYAQGGASALRSWLEVQGVRNIQALNQILTKGAKPWWDRYGGKENIEIVDTKV